MITVFNHQHAGMDFFGGYCFLNNAAIAAQALVVSLGVDTFEGDPISGFGQRAG